MGIPVGRARRHLRVGRMVRVGAIGASALAAVPAARRGMHPGGPVQQATGKIGDVTGKVGDVKGKIGDVTSKVGSVAGAVGDVEKAVSSHSTTVGKAVGLVGAVRRLGGKGGGGTGKPKLAHLIEENTEISVPRSVAYNQWTQMEMLPSLVKGVQQVEQKEDDQTQWTSKIGPISRQWKAKIVEQVPDERIVWQSEGGPEHHGVVSFHSLGDELTRVLVQMHYVPHGPFEVVGNKLRIQRRRVRRDLRLFKHFLELRGEETGAWRGGIGENSTGRSGSQSANGSGRRADTTKSANGSRSAAKSPTRSRSAARRTSNTRKEVAK